MDVLIIFVGFVFLLEVGCQMGLLFFVFLFGKYDLSLYLFMLSIFVSQLLLKIFLLFFQQFESGYQLLLAFNIASFDFLEFLNISIFLVMSFPHFIHSLVGIQIDLIGHTSANIVNLLDLTFDPFNQLFFVWVE